VGWSEDKLRQGIVIIQSAAIAEVVSQTGAHQSAVTTTGMGASELVCIGKKP
jgi:hypothetical protein